MLYELRIEVQALADGGVIKDGQCSQRPRGGVAGAGETPRVGRRVLVYADGGVAHQQDVVHQWNAR